MVKTDLENKHHWKSYYDTDYIGGFSLTDMDAVVSIVKYAKEVVENKAKKTKAEKFVLYLKDKNGEQKMIVNKTNAKNIEKALGTPDPEKWIGKQIQLCSEKVVAFGEEHDALRVRPNKPELITKISEIKTLDELQAFYLENKHLGGDFNKLVTAQKAKIESASKES